MRTAVTLGLKSDGTWQLVHGPSESIATQQGSVRNFKLGKDDRFKLMRHQESDGAAYDTAVAKVLPVRVEVKPVGKPIIAPIQPMQNPGTSAAQIMRGGRR